MAVPVLTVEELPPPPPKKTFLAPFGSCRALQKCIPQADCDIMFIDVSF